jgi:hypothetical protein
MWILKHHVMRSEPAFRAVLLAIAAVVGGTLVRAQQPEHGPKPVARGTKAMASASHPDVTRAMLDVMRRGGNAVDAALTAVILQPILEPQMSTLAGGLAMLVYEAKTGRLHYLNAELDHTSKDAPIGSTMAGAPGVAETSGRRIGVPGTLAGVHAAAERFGTKKWSEYFEPAIRVAEQGFPMYSFLYAEMADAALGRLSAHSSGRDEFLPRGFVPPVGTTVTRPRLGATLRRLAGRRSGLLLQRGMGAAIRRGGGQNRWRLVDGGSGELRSPLGGARPCHVPRERGGGLATPGDCGDAHQHDPQHPRAVRPREDAALRGVIKDAGAGPAGIWACRDAHGDVRAGSPGVRRADGRASLEGVLGVAVKAGRYELAEVWATGSR